MRSFLWADLDFKQKANRKVFGFLRFCTVTNAGRTTNINNSVKYSACGIITVNLQEHHGKLYLLISDDGKGFDVAGNHSGNGLHNFRIRAKEVGGTIDIQSAKDKGTTIHFEFNPLKG